MFGDARDVLRVRSEVKGAPSRHCPPVSGTVTAVGSDVTRTRVGDRMASETRGSRRPQGSQIRPISLFGRPEPSDSIVRKVRLNSVPGGDFQVLQRCNSIFLRQRRIGSPAGKQTQLLQ